MILKDKVALVTGAGRGFGWGIARALGRAGAKVCISDITEELSRAASLVAVALIIGPAIKAFATKKYWS